MTPRLTVVGDVVLDREVRGRAERLCPDSPAAVVEDPVTSERPGAAGLAAMLAARGDAQVTLVAPMADDSESEKLAELLSQADVTVVPVPAHGRTPTKTRIGTAAQCLARVDAGGVVPGADLGTGWQDSLTAADAVVVSDYGKGMARHRQVRAALRAARAPVVWDPHPASGDPPAACMLVTPNHLEAGAFLGRRVRASIGEASAAAEDLARHWRAAGVGVTLGAKGVVLSTGEGATLVVAPPHPQAGDPCGAGDQFSVAAAMALTEGATLSEAVARGVDCASAFIAAGGVNSLSQKDTTQNSALARGGRANWAGIVQSVRAAGGVVVATGGCFDLLHPGHLATLESARGLGDCLIVLVNSDRSVRALKGSARPITPEPDRVRMLEALACVDAVMIFDEDDPMTALRMLRPDIWVKGGDYTGQVLPERQVLAEWHGSAVTVPYVPDRSTTRLAARLQLLREKS